MELMTAARRASCLGDPQHRRRRWSMHTSRCALLLLLGQSLTRTSRICRRKVS